MNTSLSAVCYLLVTALAVYYVVIGLMDLLKKKQSNEADDTAVISRQLRGMGYLVLANVVVILGAYVCMGSPRGLGASITKLLR